MYIVWVVVPKVGRKFKEPCVRYCADIKFDMTTVRGTEGVFRMYMTRSAKQRNVKKQRSGKLWGFDHGASDIAGQK